jgi:hypothetical protein
MMTKVKVALMAGKVALILGAISASAWVGYSYKSAQSERDIAKLMQRYTAEAARASELAREAERSMSARLNLIEQIRALEAREREVIIETIENEVVRYVPTPVDCPVQHLDSEWVRLHNASATRTLPHAATPSGGLNATPRTPSDALGVVTGNYFRYQRLADQLSGLQAYVAEVCLAE